jgi:hypothetical protein
MPATDTKRRTAPEIIAIHFCSDIRDITEGRYQRYASPAVYVVGNDYYAAPANNATPRHDVGGPWQEIAQYYGRKVFRAESVS